MRTKLLAAWICLMFALTFSVNSNAQSTLIDYWNFNSFTAVMYTDTIHGIDADFSTLDTTKAQILYAEIPGTSSSFSTYIDGHAAVTADYDTVNLRMGAVAGNYIRPRNPSDSMQLLFYIPSTNYTHILLQYGSESSSTTSGPLHQLFSYSVDSGLTWRTSGLSRLSDSAWLVFHRTAVSLAMDSATKNNDKLVFRILFSGNTTGTSGNNRFDNVTVEGDTIQPATISITSAPSGSICAGTGVTFGAVASYSNVTPYYRWYVNGTVAGTDSTGFTTSTLAAGSLVQCVLTDSIDGSVLASSNVMTVTVTPLPDAGTITGATNVCPTASIPLADVASGGTWSASNDFATITSGGVVTGVTSGFDTITYQVSNTCGSAHTTFIVDVSNTPSPGVISGASTACIGVTAMLSETVSGGTWSMSNGNATISTAGVISGVTSGADTVIYTVSTCGSSDTSFPVTVIAAPVAGAITGASSVCFDSTTTLVESVSGGSWTASNSAVTITSGGVVMGVSPGTDTVIYTVTNACESVHATQIMTVNTVVNPGTISGTFTVCPGSTTPLTDAVPSGTWVALNGNATISLTGVVTGVTSGVDTIGYGFENTCGISYAITVITILPASECPSSVKTVSAAGDMLKVYPNPSNGAFTIYCGSAINENAAVTISNIVGAKVKELSIPANQAYEINMDQPAGIYLINAATSEGSYTTKIILTH